VPHCRGVDGKSSDKRRGDTALPPSYDRVPRNGCPADEIRTRDM